VQRSADERHHDEERDDDDRSRRRFHGQAPRLKRPPP
jgi:hypothetical protein